jgi:hypothetical protein
MQKHGETGIGLDRTISRLMKYQSCRNSASKALLKIGRVLAIELERQNKNSVPLLSLLDAAKHGGGPPAVLSLWPSLKIGLQQIAIRTTLPTLLDHSRPKGEIMDIAVRNLINEFIPAVDNYLEAGTAFVRWEGSANYSPTDYAKASVADNIQKKAAIAKGTALSLGTHLAEMLQANGTDNKELLDLLYVIENSPFVDESCCVAFARQWMSLNTKLRQISIRATLEAEAEIVWPAPIYKAEDDVITEPQTLGQIADAARLLYSFYPQDAKRCRCDKQNLADLDNTSLGGYKKQAKIAFQFSLQSCHRHSLALGGLALAVARKLPALWPLLRLVGSVARWHETEDFDWDAGIAELRQIEAAALSTDMATNQANGSVQTEKSSIIAKASFQEVHLLAKRVLASIYSLVKLSRSGMGLLPADLTKFQGSFERLSERYHKFKELYPAFKPELMKAIPSPEGVSACGELELYAHDIVIPLAKRVLEYENLANTQEGFDLWQKAIGEAMK